MIPLPAPPPSRQSPNASVLVDVPYEAFADKFGERPEPWRAVLGCAVRRGRRLLRWGMGRCVCVCVCVCGRR